MSNITAITPKMAIGISKRTVTIQLICTDEYAAHVLYDDLLSRASSDVGLMLKLRGKVEEKSGAPT